MSHRITCVVSNQTVLFLRFYELNNPSSRAATAVHMQRIAMSEGAQPHSATSRYPQWMQTTQNALRATGELSTRAIVAVFSLPGLSHACNAWDKFQTPFLRSPQYTPRGLGAAALTGLCLGLVGASAVWLAVIFPAYWNIFAFVACMCLFHWNEFMLQGLAHPEQLTTKCTFDTCLCTCAPLVFSFPSGAFRSCAPDATPPV
jgi:hypothetical protein